MLKKNYKSKKVKNTIIKKGDFMNRLLLTFSVVFLFISVSFVSGQNLLQNPGFEDWIDDSTCQYWYTETSGIDAVKESGTVHSGSFSAKLILRSIDTQIFTQYVAPVNSGNDYQGSICFFDNDQYIRARLYIRWYDGSGSWISSFSSSYSVNSTEWQELTAGPSAAPASAETAHFEIRMYDVSGFTDSAIIYVDDASFIDLGGISEISGNTKEFTYSVFPTISTKSVQINFTVNKAIHTEVSIFSITGRKIATLLSENLKKGKHTILWKGTTTSGERVPSGIYFIKAQMGEKTETKKVSILR